MATGGDGKAAKSTLVRGMTKKVVRTRELVLQNLGKVDKTQDGAFDGLVDAFGRQQTAAAKVHKYLANYVVGVRAAVFAADALHDVMKEVYEDDWPGKNDFENHLGSIKANSNDYLRELDRSVSALVSYQAQFHDVRSKIERRNRKLVDYDSTRHQTEQLRQVKKREDSKLMKAEEKNSDARRMYDSLNNELLELLPALYESRVVTFGSTFQSLFGAEANFHGELTRLNAGLSDIIDALFAERSVDPRRLPPAPVFSALTRGGFGGGSSRGSTPSSTRARGVGGVGGAAVGVSSDSALQSGSRSGSIASAEHHLHQGGGRHAGQYSSGMAAAVPTASPAAISSMSASYPALSGSHNSLEISNSSAFADYHEAEGKSQERGTPRLAQSDVALETRNSGAREAGLSNGACALPDNVLYQVVATHPYVREDEDELTFDAGAFINVMVNEDDDDPDEGWLFGCLDADPTMKGLFPANFTRKL